MPDRYHPTLTKYAREISSRIKYPIENFGQLMKALGGDDVVIDFEGPRGAAKNLRPVLPDTFFPVKSEQDLLAKSEQLRAKYMR